MTVRRTFSDFNSAAFWAGVSAFIFWVFGALTLQISVVQQFDISEAQARSWIFITWFSAGIVSLAFILYYRQPIGIGWTIPGLVYMASLAHRFTFEEFVGANVVAGIAILVLGLLGAGSRVMHLIPLPILMGMFAASIVTFVTHMTEAAATDFAIVGPMIAAYLVGRRLDNPRIPEVGLAVVVGAAMVVALGRIGRAPIEFAPPALVFPGVAFGLDAVVTVSVPMVVFVLGLGNVQGLGFLVAQGYRVPANALTAAVGATSIVNALLGGHPAAMTRISAAMLGAPSAGPLEKRYWSALVAFIPGTAVAFLAGPLVALVAMVPPAYILTVAGLAIFAAFEDALVRAFSGPLKLGSAVAFGVTLSTLDVAGIPSAFWALLAGMGASLIVERGEVLTQWRQVVRSPDASDATSPSQASAPRA